MDKIIRKINERVSQAMEGKTEHDDFVKGLYVAKQIVIDRINEILS